MNKICEYFNFLDIYFVYIICIKYIVKYFQYK